MVDESAAKNHKYDVINIGEDLELLLPRGSWLNQAKNDEKTSEKEADIPIKSKSENEEINEKYDPRITCFPMNLRQNELNIEKSNDKVIDELNNEMKKLDVSEGNRCDLSSASDSDNQSIVSIADSNTSVTSSDQFVVLVMPDNEKNEINEIDETKVNVENSNNVTNVCADLLTDSNDVKSETNATIDSCEEVPTKDNSDIINESEYAYIYYEGKKIPMLKKYLRPDYLVTAEDAMIPNKLQTTSQSTHSQTESADKVQDPQNTSVKVESSKPDSTTSGNPINENLNTPNNDNNRRLFVFPQNCPGFEVVYPSFELSSGNEISGNFNGSFYDNSLEHGNYNVQRPMGTYFSHNNSMSALYDMSASNYQTHSEYNSPSSRVTSPCTYRNPPQEYHCQCERVQHTVHTCPQNKPYDKVLTGAALLATSAMNTARNVLNIVAGKEVIK